MGFFYDNLIIEEVAAAPLLVFLKQLFFQTATTAHLADDYYYFANAMRVKYFSGLINILNQFQRILTYLGMSQIFS